MKRFVVSLYGKKEAERDSIKVQFIKKITHFNYYEYFDFFHQLNTDDTVQFLSSGEVEFLVIIPGMDNKSVQELLCSKIQVMIEILEELRLDASLRFLIRGNESQVAMMKPMLHGIKSRYSFSVSEFDFFLEHI